uniref:Pco110845 n=1 Tax=Arundo donax TaxID=35708 RepID=A0A0A9ELR5_ARUDO
MHQCNLCNQQLARSLFVCSPSSAGTKLSLPQDCCLVLVLVLLSSSRNFSFLGSSLGSVTL